MEHTPYQANPECGTKERQEPQVEIGTQLEGAMPVSDVQMELEEEEQVEAAKQQEGEKQPGIELGKAEVLEPPAQQFELESEMQLGKGEQGGSEIVAQECEAEGRRQPDCPSASPGSLAFPFLEEQAKAVLCTSCTLVVLKGLPGSGKSFLAKAIKDAYKDVCAIISADDHNVSPEDYDASGEALKAVDEAVLTSFAAGTAVVVVDDANLTPGRLAQLNELAEQHQYCALFVEPRTEWSQDLEQLLKRTRWKLGKKRLVMMKATLHETSIPLFYGWFVCKPFQQHLRAMAADLLKSLANLEAFKCHIDDFSDKAEKQVDLEEYFHPTGTLHCTTKLCDYGCAEGAKEYAENQFVKKLYGGITELVLSCLFVTPRTLGARVPLTEEQLQLWPADENGVASGSSLPQDNCAHISLGCAEGVVPMQTGLDLLELLQLQQGQTGESVQDLELGLLTYYGKGMWVLDLHEPCKVAACFCSYYGYREETGKEREVEKKLKCMVQ